MTFTEAAFIGMAMVLAFGLGTLLWAYLVRPEKTPTKSGHAH
jgi:hypothetical protein